VQMVAIAEALAILAKAGADLGQWCDVVAAGHGMADTPLFRARAKEMLMAEPEVAGKLRIGAKDIGLAAALAAELGVDAQLFARADLDYQAALAQGLGETDTASVARAVEARTGVHITG
jgi:3-hydroxyisobutyrate dehydrogenase-like beta-hydroxyacid dehydrogenase